MSRDLQVYIDDSPGETRGIIEGERGFEHILIQREVDDLARRLDAVSVGRVSRVEPGLNGAFVDLGGGEGFLPLKRNAPLHVGQKIEVEVVAEPRETKGPTLRLLGPAEGEARLIRSGPDIGEWLARLAPGVGPITGKAAIEAGWAAIEDAQAPAMPAAGPDVAVERTRAMITVDIDQPPQPGKGLSARDRQRANQEGLNIAARLIRLRRWGGLAAIDLLGAGHDGAQITAAARTAFGTDPAIAYGPVNRFGVLQLVLPWRLTPLEELTRPGVEAAACEAARKLNHALLADTGRARVTARCHGEIAKAAAPLVARLGPRAHVIPDDSLPMTRVIIE
ncbi:MAG: RNA-binding protein [Brevundimonas sp.]|uniref:RNA-binding protein n=1 Tax=Brevundimonas sp. TaxID=1871086 RepID=UPI00391BA012